MKVLLTFAFGLFLSAWTHGTNPTPPATNHMITEASDNMITEDSNQMVTE